LAGQVRYIVLSDLHLGRLPDRLRHGFAREWDRPLLGEVTMVAGRTHKPFSQWWRDPAWPAGGMRVVN
jgi:hypothetical protein